MTPLHVRVPADVIGEVIDGEAVLLNLTTGIYFGLNASGTTAWRLLRDTGSGEIAVNGLMQHWGIDRERAEHDVLGLVAALEEKGLISRT